EAIKQMCRQRNLQVSGQRFDLVLRILHNDNDSTPEGKTLKRAATETVTTLDTKTGEVVEKQVPKKRKKAAPSASRVYTRVQKKIEAVKQKKYQSHWGSKTHGTDVYSLVAEILTNEVINAPEAYLTKDPRFGLSIAKAAITSLSDNFHSMERPGYDDDDGWSTIDRSLLTIAQAVRPILSEEEREEFAEWVEELDSTGEPYGLTMYTEFSKTVAFIRGEEEEEDDERKPAAKPTLDDLKPLFKKPADEDSKPAAKPIEEDSKPAAKPTEEDIKPAAKTPAVDELKPAAMTKVEDHKPAAATAIATEKPVGGDTDVAVGSNNLIKENVKNDSTTV
ncbi:hypothetical protein ACHAWC_001255, partial [Mediolabrus comicus]